MDKPFNLKDIIKNFQAIHCVWKKGKKYGDWHPQVPISQRKELLTILVLKIKEQGKQKNFFTNSRRDEIVEELTPPKRKEMKLYTKKMLDWVIEICYDENSNIKFEDLELPKSENKSTIEAQEEKNQGQKTEFLNGDNQEEKEPPVEDVLDEEMAKLLGYTK